MTTLYDTVFGNPNNQPVEVNNRPFGEVNNQPYDYLHYDDEEPEEVLNPSTFHSVLERVERERAIDLYRQQIPGLYLEEVQEDLLTKDDFRRFRGGRIMPLSDISVTLLQSPFPGQDNIIMSGTWRLLESFYNSICNVKAKIEITMTNSDGDFIMEVTVEDFSVLTLRSEHELAYARYMDQNREPVNQENIPDILADWTQRAEEQQRQKEADPGFLAFLPNWLRKYERGVDPQNVPAEMMKRATVAYDYYCREAQIASENRERLIAKETAEKEQRIEEILLALHVMVVGR